MNLARQLSAPLFVVDLDAKQLAHPVLDLAYELLAEAQLSLFRRLRRLTVLNSCVAVETVANHVFKSRRTAQATADGKTLQEAELLAEQERKDHRTDHNFLLHKGLKAACGRSLHEEHQQDYIRFGAIKQDRHMVAHAGEMVSEELAKECFDLCCRLVRWLASVNGWSVKPLVPEMKQCISGFSTGSRDAHALSAPEIEAIRGMFGVVLPQKV
jgi:hypothetical protein